MIRILPAKKQKGKRWAKAMTMEYVYKSFFEAVNHGGIEPIIKTAHSLLQFPIILNDNSGCTLMQLPDMKLDDPDWDYSFENKTIQREHYLNLYNNFISKTELHNRPVHVKEGFLEERHQVIVVVAYRQEILGLLSLIVNKDTLSQQEYDIIQVFIDALRSELKRNLLNIQQERNKLATVIQEDDTSSSSYQLALSSLSKLYPGNYQLIISKPRISKDIPILDAISKDLNKNCPNCIAAVVDNYLVVLLFRISDKTNSCQKALQLLSTYPYISATSTIFEAIDTIKDYHYQTRMTLNCGITLHPNKREYHFEDYVPYQIIAAAANSGSIITFIDPLVQEIAAYDAENSTEYLATLDAYLYRRQSKTETIRQLFIHQNTLTYRLKRMEELFHIDFEDMIAIQNLYASVMAWKYLNGRAAEIDK